MTWTYEKPYTHTSTSQLYSEIIFTHKGNSHFEANFIKLTLISSHTCKRNGFSSSITEEVSLLFSSNSFGLFSSLMEQKELVQNTNIEKRLSLKVLVYAVGSSNSILFRFIAPIYAHIYAVHTFCHSTIIRSHTIKQSISFVNIFHRPHSRLNCQTVSIVDTKQRVARLEISRLLEIINRSVKLVFLSKITIPSIGATLPKVKANLLDQFTLLIPTIYYLLSNVFTTQRAAISLFSRSSEIFNNSDNPKDKTISRLSSKVKSNDMNEILPKNHNFCCLHSTLFLVMSVKDK